MAKFETTTTTKSGKADAGTTATNQEVKEQTTLLFNNSRTRTTWYTLLSAVFQTNKEQHQNLETRRTKRKEEKKPL